MMNGMYGVSGYGTFPGVPTIGAVPQGMAGFIYGFLTMLCVALLALAIAAYILRSIGVYTIAKHREIENPWLAWLPFGDLWILGSISDQYQYVVKGRVHNRRKTLLALMLATWAVLALTIISAAAFLIAGLQRNATASGISLIILLLSELVVVVLVIIFLVYFYMAMYDLYASCEPYNAAACLVLSILFVVVQPFFIFFCRNKELGMPPRKQTVQPVVSEVPPQSADWENMTVQFDPPAAEEVPVAEEAPVAEETPVAEEASVAEETTQETE